MTKKDSFGKVCAFGSEKAVISRSGFLVCPWVDYDKDAHLRDVFTSCITNISTKYFEILHGASGSDLVCKLPILLYERLI